MHIILLRDDQRHVLATRGHIQGGNSKNTNTFVMCLDHSTV